ncbi:hypothetical protein Rhopal_006130-T1 [Rhodotorula paludigena]|uniref:RBR-type E3 ubiquitin transferase n=1 Tax=Rhodotorula paludigena TaxID=86838 RepID=A0AAV5GT43_9BASI|nr:hypothetical protein Rhopal_006130-T1 [Rhodotorula paludigena]
MPASASTQPHIAPDSPRTTSEVGTEDWDVAQAKAPEGAQSTPTQPKTAQGPSERVLDDDNLATRHGKLRAPRSSSQVVPHPPSPDFPTQANESQDYVCEHRHVYNDLATYLTVRHIGEGAAKQADGKSCGTRPGMALEMKGVAISSDTSMADAELLASLQAATRLSLADLRDLNLVSTSSPRFGASQDELLARDLWRRELQAHSAVLRDRTLARDLQTALRTNQTIETVRRRREQATQDAQDSSVADHNDAVMLDSDGSDSDSELFRLPRLAPFVPLERAALTASSPAETVSVSTSAALPVSTRLSCYTCLSNVNLQTRRLDCGHVYCFPCLRDLFRAATRTESLHPASCCKRTIDVGVTMGALSAGDRAAYIRSVQEFASGDRLYCASPRCSAFLGSNLSKKQGKAIKCPNCQETTCSACKAPAHLDTQVCAADNDDTAATKLVKLVRGVRCGACRRVVEKNGGCENVTCLCGTHLEIY